MPPPISVDKPIGRRFDLALDDFAEGGPFIFQGCVLCLRGGFVEVRVPASWEVENTDERRARDDLERARLNLGRLHATSTRFSGIVGQRPMRLVLVHDYGMGGLELCELEDGRFTWRPGYPHRPPGV